MKKYLLILITAIGGFIFGDDLSHVVYTRVLVFDQDLVADKLIEWCEDEDGYYTQRTRDRLLLRIPNSKLSSFKDFLKENSEEIIDYSQESNNLSFTVAELKSGIKAREEILAQNLLYLSDSDTEGTLELEKEIRRVRGDLDNLKGTLTKLENDMAMAQISISLSFNNSVIDGDSYSSFSWINDVNFFTIMNRNMTDDERGFRGPVTAVPDGFAMVDRKPELRAITPEGGRFILVSYDNYPEQSIEFWNRTLEAHLKKTGYIQIGKSFNYEPNGETPFTTTKWGVSYGNRDYIFMIGLRLNRKKIEVLQVAMEAELFSDYF